MYFTKRGERVYELKSSFVNLSTSFCIDKQRGNKCTFSVSSLSYKSTKTFIWRKFLISFIENPHVQNRERAIVEKVAEEDRMTLTDQESVHQLLEETGYSRHGHISFTLLSRLWELIRGGNSYATLIAESILEAYLGGMNIEIPNQRGRLAEVLARLNPHEDIGIQIMRKARCLGHDGEHVRLDAHSKQDDDRTNGIRMGIY